MYVIDLGIKISKLYSLALCSNRIVIEGVFVMYVYLDQYMLLWFSFRCPFIRGEYTENVSITCTEATHPAQCYCPSDANTEVSGNVTLCTIVNITYMQLLFLVVRNLNTYMRPGLRISTM